MKKTKNMIYILLLIVVLCTIGGIFAKYRSETETNKELEIAYYVLESEHQIQQLKLEAMVPREEPYKYGINVFNSKDGRVSETAIEYIIQVKTTTNLPLLFELKEEGNDENQFVDTQTFQDENEVYYIIKKTELKEFSLKEENHKYILEITFPQEYKANSEYADILELVEVTVDSQQKI